MHALSSKHRLVWESKGSRFFATTPFRSGFFLINTVQFAALVITDAIVLVKYWDRLSTGMALWLFVMVYVGAVGPMRRALLQHRRIHEFYLSGKIMKC